MFESPGYLALLGLLPVVWYLGRRSLSGLGRVRRWVVIGLRSAMIVLLALALAEVQWLRTSDQLSVVYLLDQSASIPAVQRQAMFDYVTREVAAHRDAGRRDKAGVILFGRTAAVESPPFESSLSWLRTSPPLPLVAPDATNLAAAMKLAMATFPEDSARRVVIVSDGNQNLGDARTAAQLLTDAGIGIDVVPVPLRAQSEVAVEKIWLPTDIQRGQKIEARVVLDTHIVPGAEKNPGPVSGRLRLSRVAGQREQLLDETPVTLQPGKSVFRFAHQIDESGAYTYKARFVPDDPARDTMAQNNDVTAFTQVRGRGRVLLIENHKHPGDFDRLASGLRSQEIEVTLIGSDSLFTSLAELQAYDCVVLANVPRIDSDDQGRGPVFSDDQVSMLVRNTEQMGCGLVMLGGDESLGAGGWTNTDLEKAMPVDFQIKNSKVAPVGALLMVMDKSGSMAGEKILLSQRAALAALSMLSPQDYVGVVAFDSEARWALPLRRVEQNPQAARLLRQIGAAGGTDMFPGMQQGYAALSRVSAGVKHMILLTDGQTAPADFDELTRRMRADKITVSAVAIGDNAATPLLSGIAQQGGGKYYHVRNPRAIPKIFMKEALRVARPLIYERPEGMTPRLHEAHEMLEGIEGDLPPVTGYVLTTVKDNPLVDVPIVAPLPSNERNCTLLAGWQYGLGRSVVFTSDAGRRWATDWTAWEGYDKFFSQIVRWSMRPNIDEGRFLTSTDVHDGRVRVIVTALDPEDEFLNFLVMSAAVIDPDMQSFELPIEQIAPGRYVGEFKADRPGSYFVTVAPGAGAAPLRLGVNVPYSSEFRDLETNAAFLESLSSLRPQGGEAGEVIEGALESSAGDAASAADTFRHNLMRPVSTQEMWPLVLVVASCVFFCDVLVRRVSLDMGWLTSRLTQARAWLLRREPPPAPDERIARLRARKQALADQFESRQAAARRYEASEETAVTARLVDDLEEAVRQGGDAPPRPRQDAAALEPDATDEDYTARLLAAKRRATPRNRNES